MPTFEQTQNARRVYDIIDKHPERHNQETWGFKSTECGSVACISGHLALMHGLAEYEMNEYTGYHRLTLKDPNSDFYTVGQELLGLSDDDAHNLFYCENNEMAKAALLYLANGMNIDWEKLDKEFGYDGE